MDFFFIDFKIYKILCRILGLEFSDIQKNEIMYELIIDEQ